MDVEADDVGAEAVSASDDVGGDRAVEEVLREVDGVAEGGDFHDGAGVEDDVIGGAGEHGLIAVGAETEAGGGFELLCENAAVLVEILSERSHATRPSFFLSRRSRR